MKTQRGVSLIELMIAMSIGLFLILGLGTVFYTMQTSASARQGLSTLQNNERMAMTFLGADIQGAGFFPFVNSGTNAQLYFQPVANSFSSGQSIFGVSSGAGGTTDTLSVRFVTPLASAPSAVAQGCAANLPAITSYTDTFSIQPSLPGVPVTSDLVCTEANTNVGGTTQAIHLIAGVQGMIVLYGVDTTGQGSVTEYVPASAITNWGTVKTVNVTLLFANPLAQPGQTLPPVSFSRTVPYMNGL